MFMLKRTHRKIVKTLVEFNEELTRQLHEAGDARNRNQGRADYVEAKLAEIMDTLNKMPRTAREG